MQLKNSAKKTLIKQNPIIKKEDEIFVADTQDKKGSVSKIKINSDDLLFAVTHSTEEVKEYYANIRLIEKT